jgi:hypothetical protein
MRKLMKQEVSSIIDEIRQPATVTEKTSKWFSNFLEAVSPTTEVNLRALRGDAIESTTSGSLSAALAALSPSSMDTSLVGRGEAIERGKRGPLPIPEGLPEGTTEKDGVFYNAQGQSIGERGLSGSLIQPGDLLGLSGSVTAKPLLKLVGTLAKKWNMAPKEIGLEVAQQIPEVFKKAVFDVSNRPAFKSMARPDLVGNPQAREALKQEVLKNLDGITDDVGASVMSKAEKKFVAFFKEGLVKKSKQEEVLTSLKELADADPGAFSGMYDIFKSIGGK